MSKLDEIVLRMLSDVDGVKAYVALEKAYDAFYELPLQERLYESGMATRPSTSHK